MQREPSPLDRRSYVSSCGGTAAQGGAAIKHFQMPGLWWHSCDRWRAQGLRCPFNELDRFEDDPDEPDHEPPTIQKRQKTKKAGESVKHSHVGHSGLDAVSGLPHASGAQEGQRDFHEGRRILETPSVSDLVKGAEGARQVGIPQPAPGQTVGIPGGQGAVGEQAVDADSRNRELIKRAGSIGGAKAPSIPQQLKGTIGELAKSMQRSAQRTKDRSRSSSQQKSKALGKSFATAAGATATAAASGGSSGQLGPPSAPAELQSSIAIAESQLARSTSRQRRTSRGRRAPVTPGPPDEVGQQREVGDRRREAEQARQQRESAERTKRRKVAAIAAAGLATVGAGMLTRMGRGGPPAGGGFHMRDVISPRRRFAN